MEAIILCGKGTRLYPLTKNIPKCLVRAKGKPLIDYQLKWLSRYDITKVVITCSQKHIRKVMKHTGLMQYRMDMEYSAEKESLGTGGAIRNALKYIDGNDFIVLNCDDMVDININLLITLGSPALCVVPFRSPFGLVIHDGSGSFYFKQKPVIEGHYTYIGVALFNKNMDFPERGDFEDLVLPELTFFNLLKYEGVWLTINTPRDLKNFEDHLERRPIGIYY